MDWRNLIAEATILFGLVAFAVWVLRHLAAC